MTTSRQRVFYVEQRASQRKEYASLYCQQLQAITNQYFLDVVLIDLQLT